MSFSGLKKQFNKANQYLSETMGAAEATKLDEDYMEMEKKVDLTNDLISALIAGTHEYLQPNPATRAKMTMAGAFSKVRGTTKSLPYPQVEGLLADTMQKYGSALGPSSDFGKALLDTSEAYRQMADIKYQMEDSVKHNFLDPLSHVQQTDIKEVNHHRTKLKGRRLDYDCKKRKQVRDDEMIQAEEKLEESKQLAEQAMYNLLSNDVSYLLVLTVQFDEFFVEQVSQLSALVDAQLDFHRRTTQVLEQLQQSLHKRVEEVGSRPRTEHVVKPVLTRRTPRNRSPVPDIASSTNINYQPPTQDAFKPFSTDGGDWNSTSSSISGTQSVAGSQTVGGKPYFSQNPSPTPATAPTKKPLAKALYDFEAQNEGELDFKEGDMLDLVSQIDENWFEGRLNGKTGYFPISYVQVLVPL
uniref:SH3 domain-containing GRB2-like protein n=1 Tax=Syphacia muris TaxID=451379 RepID=A0A0N5A8S6_9BILA